MSATASRLIRPDLRGLAGYSAASPDRDAVRLHANELPWDASNATLNRYPEPQPRELIGRLAALYGVDAANVLATRGSDDAIDLLVRCFCRAGRDSILVCPPTFGMYEVAARLQNAAVRRLPLPADGGFVPDAGSVVSAVTASTRLVFLCTPNNPTGSVIPAEAVESLCGVLRGRALVVVDEAYIEFADAPSIAPRVEAHDNLVVLRTLSKAYGLAGARCGALIAGSELIETVRPALPPYALPTPTIVAALAALSETGLGELDERIDAVRRERQRLRSRLDTLSVVRRTWPSEGNFLLAEVRDREKVLAACRERGFLIRDLSGYAGLTRHVRITVGTPRQNDELVAILEAMS